MAKILHEGCVESCSHCKTKFSFMPSEVSVSKVDVPPGYEPGEVGYKKSIYFILCPKCHNAVNVSNSLGHDAKRSADRRASESEMREDYDL